MYDNLRGRDNDIVHGFILCNNYINLEKGKDKKPTDH